MAVKIEWGILIIFLLDILWYVLDRLWTLFKHHYTLQFPYEIAIKDNVPLPDDPSLDQSIEEDEDAEDNVEARKKLHIDTAAFKITDDFDTENYVIKNNKFVLSDDPLTPIIIEDDYSSKSTLTGFTDNWDHVNKCLLSSGKSKVSNNNTTTSEKVPKNATGELLEDYTTSNNNPSEEVVSTPVDAYEMLEWTLDHQIELSLQNKIKNENISLDYFETNSLIPQINLSEEVVLIPSELDTDKENITIRPSDEDKDKNALHEYPLGENDSSKKSKLRKKRSQLRRKTTSINLSDILAQQLVTQDEDCVITEDNHSVPLPESNKTVNQNIEMGVEYPESKNCELLPENNLTEDVVLGSTELDTDKEIVKLSPSEDNKVRNTLNEYPLCEKDSSKKSKLKKKRCQSRRKTTSINLSEILAQQLVTDDDECVTVKDNNSLTLAKNTLSINQDSKIEDEYPESKDCELPDLVPVDKDPSDNIINNGMPDMLVEGELLESFNKSNNSASNHLVKRQEATDIHKNTFSECTQPTDVKIVFTLEKLQPLEDTTERLEAMMTLHNTDLSQENRVIVEDNAKNMSLKTMVQEDTENLNQAYLDDTTENIDKYMILKNDEHADTDNVDQTYQDIIAEDFPSTFLKTGGHAVIETVNETYLGDIHEYVSKNVVLKPDEHVCADNTDIKYEYSSDHIDEEAFKLSEEKMPESFIDNKDDFQIDKEQHEISCNNDHRPIVDEYINYIISEAYSIHNKLLRDNSKIMQYISRIVDESISAAYEQIMISNDASKNVIEEICSNTISNLISCNTSEEFYENQILFVAIVDTIEISNTETTNTDQFCERDIEIKIPDEEKSTHKNGNLKIQNNDKKGEVEKEQNMNQYISNIVNDIITYSILQSIKSTELSKSSNYRNIIKESNMESINTDIENKEDMEASDNWEIIDMSSSEDMQTDPNISDSILPTNKYSSPIIIELDNTAEKYHSIDLEKEYKFDRDRESILLNVQKKEDKCHLNESSEYASDFMISDALSVDQLLYNYATSINCGGHECTNKDLKAEHSDIHCTQDNISISNVVDSIEVNHSHQDNPNNNENYTNDSCNSSNENLHKNHQLHQQIEANMLCSYSNENTEGNTDDLRTTSSFCMNTTLKNDTADRDTITILLKEKLSDEEYMESTDYSNLTVYENNKEPYLSDILQLSKENLSHKLNTSSDELESTHDCINKCMIEQPVDYNTLSTNDSTDVSLDVNNTQNNISIIPNTMNHKEDNTIFENDEDNNDVANLDKLNVIHPTIYNDSMTFEETNKWLEQLTSKENNLDSDGIITASCKVDITEQPKLVSDTLAVLAHLDQLNNYLIKSNSLDTHEICSTDSVIPRPGEEYLNQHKKYPTTNNENTHDIQDMQSVDDSWSILCDSKSDQGTAQTISKNTNFENKCITNTNVIDEIETENVATHEEHRDGLDSHSQNCDSLPNLKSNVLTQSCELQDVDDNIEQLATLGYLGACSETKETEKLLQDQDLPLVLCNPPEIESTLQSSQIPQDNNKEIAYTKPTHQILEPKDHIDSPISLTIYEQPLIARQSQEKRIEIDIIRQNKTKNTPEVSRRPQNTSAVVSAMAPMVGMMLPEFSSQEFDAHITRQQSLDTQQLSSDTTTVQSILSQVAASGSIHNVISQEDATQGVVAVIGGILMESFNF